MIYRDAVFLIKVAEAFSWLGMHGCWKRWRKIFFINILLCYRPSNDETDLNPTQRPVNLMYQKPEKSGKKRRRKPRNVIYFNPPYSKTVKTNVIKLFLSLIDKHFPKGHKFHKCFNRNTVKATYCTLSNMMDKIGNHNAKILSKEKEPKVDIVNKVSTSKVLSRPIQLPFDAR